MLADESPCHGDVARHPCQCTDDASPACLPPGAFAGTQLFVSSTGSRPGYFFANENAAWNIFEIWRHLQHKSPSAMYVDVVH